MNFLEVDAFSFGGFSYFLLRRALHYRFNLGNGYYRQEFGEEEEECEEQPQ